MVAAMHIVGAVIALILMSTLLYVFAAWIDKSYSRRVMQQASIDLALPISDLSSPAFERDLIRYFGAKYSHDLLKNRLSDLLGAMLTAYTWVASLVQIVFIGFVIWFTLTDDQGNAVYAWFVLPISLIAFVLALGVHYLCVLLTGRFPGQANQGRKMLSQSVDRSAAPSANS